MTHITVTEASFEELKELYHKAVKQKDDIFIFKGQEILVSFAKYLIEYYEPILKKG